MGEKVRANRGFALVPGEDVGGPRHFLDGQPVHCGVGLILCGADDDVRPNRDQPVRYEAALYSGRVAAWVYGDVAGWEFRRRVVSEMRFLWPRGTSC